MTVPGPRDGRSRSPIAAFRPLEIPRGRRDCAVIRNGRHPSPPSAKDHQDPPFRSGLYDAAKSPTGDGRRSSFDDRSGSERSDSLVPGYDSSIYRVMLVIIFGYNRPRDA